MQYQGINLLKVLAMLFIMSLHVTTHGGIIEIASHDKYLFWMWEAICFCGVNCYALISGFLAYGKKVRISRCILLWMQVVFFGVLACVIFKMVNPGLVSGDELLKAVLPVTFNQYWYFTAYLVVSIVSPLLNYFVENIDEAVAKKVLVISFAVFSFYATIESVFNDAFGLGGGFSWFWLAILYVTGAIFRKYNWEYNNKKVVILLVLAWTFSWLWAVFAGKYIGAFDQLLFKYTSPTMVIISVCLLLLCLNVKKENKIVSFIAKSTFAAYLFQDNLLMRMNYVKGRYAFLNEYNQVYMVLLIIGIALAYLLLGIFLDKFRIVIFNVVRAEKTAQKIENRFKAWFDRVAA